ncbi:unnamed protein product, partial [Candidula unifasciata]
MIVLDSPFFLATLACVLMTAKSSGQNPNNYVVDISEPNEPGPFHDLTRTELIKLRSFLEKEPNIRAEKSNNASVGSSYIFTADVFLPKKADVLKFLDGAGRCPRPERRARVIMFRGDKSPAVVEEYICGPLPEVSRCDLLNLTTFRNPVEFSVRPFNGLETAAMETVILREVDRR